MSRKRTGLRNRNRSGRSTYSRKRKGLLADHYGQFVQGHRTGRNEAVAGHVLSYDLLADKS